MNLYRISQTENDGYDTFDSAIVAALTEDEARRIHPQESYGHGPVRWAEDGSNDPWVRAGGTWARSPEAVSVVLIGTASGDTPDGVVLASFNAG